MIAHLVNCTYCTHRLVSAGNKKKHIPEMERCGLTRELIPPPSAAGRFCEKFHQEGHECKSCLTPVVQI